MALAFEIVLLVIGSLVVLTGAVTVAVLLADGKMTLPGSEVRRVKKAAADLEISRYREQQTLVDLRLDSLQEQRLERALNPGEKQRGAGEQVLDRATD